MQGIQPERPTSSYRSNRTPSRAVLDLAEPRLRGWSASLGRVGFEQWYGGELPGPFPGDRQFRRFPAGMFAGLLTAAKTAASGSTEMANLAEKAGTSVEAISALGLTHRAKKFRVDADALAIRRQEHATVPITDAARGGIQGREALAGPRTLRPPSLAGCCPRINSSGSPIGLPRFRTRPNAPPRP